ncbi:hypothetical protein FB446DRAFT_794386 [Lentinula raphanica]|nr:hypothetical protein FB446DRAFT_794386 [Lentinula raphanica]
MSTKPCNPMLKRLKQRNEPASVDDQFLQIAGPPVAVEFSAFYPTESPSLWMMCSMLTFQERFEKGLASVLTIRDFTQIFDAYAEFGASLISAMMESLADEEDDEEEAAKTEKELDMKMKQFEELMDRKPFLINNVLIRRNPNDVQEWEKLTWGGRRKAETYTRALKTINPRKGTANLHRLYVNFAKFYEEGGTARQAEPDLDSARKILET